MFLKPNNGLSVRCPVKGVPLPKEGAEVPDTIFWRRRLSDGDVILSSQKESLPVKQSQPKNAGGSE